MHQTVPTPTQTEGFRFDFGAPPVPLAGATPALSRRSIGVVTSRPLRVSCGVQTAQITQATGPTYGPNVCTDMGDVRDDAQGLSGSCVRDGVLGEGGARANSCLSHNRYAVLADDEAEVDDSSSSRGTDMRSSSEMFEIPEVDTRRARNGHYYTLEGFKQYYGDSWRTWWDGTAEENSDCWVELSGVVSIRTAVADRFPHGVHSHSAPWWAKGTWPEVINCPRPPFYFSNLVSFPNYFVRGLSGTVLV